MILNWMLVLFFVALWSILQGDLFYVLTLCYFVLVFFSPFSIAITSLGEGRANLCAFRTFVRFVLVWFYRFPLPLGVWKGLRFVIVSLSGLFSYFFSLFFRENTSPAIKLISLKFDFVHFVQFVAFIHSILVSG